MITRCFLFVVFVFSCLNVHANDYNNSEIVDFLNDVVNSFNEQDCAKYSSHFIKPLRQKKRRDSGLYFASNNSTMSLKESHVLSEGETELEVAVSYKLKSDDQDAEFVSRIFLEKEEDSWKISKELIVSNKSEYDLLATGQFQVVNNQAVSYTSNPFANQSLPPQPQQQNCSNGRCGGPQAPFSSLKACRDYGFDPIPCRNGSCSTR